MDVHFISEGSYQRCKSIFRIYWFLKKKLFCELFGNSVVLSIMEKHHEAQRSKLYLKMIIA